MLIIAQKLRDLEIIHADVKPDNFLVLDLPDIDPSHAGTDFFSRLRPSIQLFDFGRCIDTKMYPRGKTFDLVFSNKKLRCPEMQEGKPWTYQIDYFGIAGTAYILLSGDYMKLSKNKEGKNFPTGSMRRWWNADLWTSFFMEFLNIESEHQLPNLDAWLRTFQDFFLANKMAQWADIRKKIKSGLKDKVWTKFT